MRFVRDLWHLLKETYSEWDRHQAPKLGAALAYYTVLALAPLLIVVIAVMGLVLGREAARGEIVAEIQAMVGGQGARAIETVITNANKPASGTIASILGLITLFVGASGVFSELRDSLNRIWDIPAKESGGVMSQIRSRFLSFGMVLAIGFLLLVSLVISAGIAAAGKYMGGMFPVPPVLMQVVNTVVSLAIVTVLFAMIYRVLPDEKVAWKDVGLGAFVTALLFTIGKLAIGLYLGKASIGSAYGAAGSLVIVLVWVYYSAQIFFFGAEFTHVYAVAHGSLRGKVKDRGAQVVTVPAEKLAPQPAAAPVPLAQTPPPQVPTGVSRSAGPPDSMLAPSAARAVGLVVVAALGGLGWWRTRSARRRAGGS